MTIKDSGRGETPFRIPVNGFMLQTEDELRANSVANAHYTKIGLEAPKTKPLAICGGGPSLADALEVLDEWDGPIWAVNRTPDWLKANDIASIMVTVDACDDPGAFCDPASVSEAIFSSWCNPAVASRYSSVRMVDMFPLFPKGLVGTTTSAGCMSLLAFRMGYRDVTLFGCEGSFTDNDHVDRHEGQLDQFIIRANGGEHRTTPDLLMQCDELSQLVRDLPGHLKEQSGGLLRAMVADPKWETVAVSGPLKQHLETSGMTGFHPYEGS